MQVGAANCFRAKDASKMHMRLLWKQRVGKGTCGMDDAVKRRQAATESLAKSNDLARAGDIACLDPEAGAECLERCILGCFGSLYSSMA